MSDPNGLGNPQPSVNIRPGGLIHNSLTHEPPPQTMPMSMSLGVLGDLMWVRIPGSRLLLAERIAEEVQDAIDGNRALYTLSPWEVVAQVLWDPMMQDALGDFPRSRAPLTALCAVIREAHAWEGKEGEDIRHALWDYPLPWLLEPDHRTVIEQVDPELIQLVVRENPGR